MQSGTLQRETVVIGGGCFWCIEAVLEGFKGVEQVTSGYAGGTTENPTYAQVASQASGHAEVVEVQFNKEQISLRQLLNVFFHAHDPTTRNRQGNDVGPEYRSIILYADEEQKRAAEEVLRDIADKKLWGDKPIVTEIVPLKKFYPAEEEHQNYFRNNPEKAYCSIVIAPKVQKIRKEFAVLLK